MFVIWRQSMLSSRLEHSLVYCIEITDITVKLLRLQQTLYTKDMFVYGDDNNGGGWGNYCHI